MRAISNNMIDIITKEAFLVHQTIFLFINNLRLQKAKSFLKKIKGKSTLNDGIFYFDTFLN
jgi:hypothetical protein